MANRSYIFITDNYKGENVKAKGISEFSYNVPAAYLLLSAYNTQAVSSKLFKDEPAIIADFDKGKQLLIDVLAAIAAVYPDDDTHAEFSAITANFLGGLKAKFVLLENHEVYVLGEDDYEEQNENMISTAVNLRATAEDMVHRHKEGLLSYDTLTDDENDMISDIADELDELEDIADFWTEGIYQDLSEADPESDEEEYDDDDYVDIEIPKETRVFDVKGSNWQHRTVAYGDNNSLSVRIDYDADIAKVFDKSTYTYNARVVVLLPQEEESEKLIQEATLLEALKNVDCKLVAAMHYLSKVEYIFQINAISNFVSAAEKWVNRYNYKAEKERGATRDEAKIIRKEGWDFYNEKVVPNL